MNEQVKTLSEAAAKLESDERIELVELIMAGLAGQEVDVQAAWLREVNLRRAAYLAGETETYDFDEVLAEVPEPAKT
jgi:Putative addiction module component